jgi:dTDP-glucose 4,6-dehydratase
MTGVTGTIGGQLADELLKSGEEVHSLERYVTGRYSLDRNGNVRIVNGDLRDFSAIRHIVQEVQPEIVIHLAATSPVSYSYDHPHEVMETNLMGTINLAEACRTLVPHLKQFLFASTSETYGNGPLPKTEETLQIPNSPYSVSKHAAESYLGYLKDAYEFPVTILRPFNTYGRKTNQHFVVERMIVQMLSGARVRLGDPDAIRDFLYVDDHIRAYMACLNKPKAIGQTFNFCTGKKISIRELSRKLASMTGFEGQVLWHQTPARPLDIKRLVGSYEKASKVLGWRPRVDLDSGLKRTVDHWKGKIRARETVR